tara:strand:+ start:420 stop:1610 length:1191 start_codon:yes stop_codon:yes gene_type:complete
MNIQEIEIEKLIPYHNNPRKDQAVDKVASSINEYGFQQPIVVDKNMVLIVGHTRLMGAKKLGLKKVPVTIANLSESKAKAYRIADNRLNEDSAWDFDLLDIEIKNLLDDDYNIDLLGFDSSELDKFLKNDEQYLTDEDEVPEPPKEPNSKLGDIYELGEHRLMCGDSTKESDIIKLMNGQKAEMVFTDPPYGMFLETDYSKIKGSEKSIGFKGNKKGNKYNKILGDNEDFTDLLISNIFKNFKYCKEIFIWGGDYFVDLLPNYGKDGSWFVWNKRSSEAQQKGIGNCFELLWSKKKHKRIVYDFEWFGFLSKDDPKEARNRLHPSMKPTILLTKIIESYSEKNNLIADIYLGSGSTLIACEKTKRKCYGIELDPTYVDVIIQRWENFTGKKAKKIN